MRPYRSNDFNDERKWKRTEIIEDVTKVGILKAMGYIQYDPEMVDRFVHDGKFIHVAEGPLHIPVTLLYVGDRSMMTPIVDRHAALLKIEGWPTDAEGVFNRVCQESVPHEGHEQLYHVICELFNSWCLWCERPLRREGAKFFSKNPYGDPV